MDGILPTNDRLPRDLQVTRAGGAMASCPLLEVSLIPDAAV